MWHANSEPIANFSPTTTGKSRGKRDIIRLGFVALTDCAPLVVARQLGLFEKRGLNVELSREIGWATIREKIIHGELEAAHAPAGMVFAAAAGLGGVSAACLTGMVLNLHGNAITLSQQLWQAGVRDGHTLRELVRRRKRPVTLGTVYQWSSHSVLLRLWLKEHGLDAENDAQVIVLPPTQMVAHLRAGHLDGFCAGEPWNSIAVMARAGWVVARSAELAPLHPEKVLMVRSEFASQADEQHVALIAALLEAARYCDDPANREAVVKTLARPDCVGADAEVIRRSMGSVFDYGNGRIEPCQGFHIFSQENANDPDARKAAWVSQSLIASGLATTALLPRDLGAKCFRPDIFARARALAALPVSSSAS